MFTLIWESGVKLIWCQQCSRLGFRGICRTHIVVLRSHRRSERWASSPACSPSSWSASGSNDGRSSTWWRPAGVSHQGLCSTRTLKLWTITPWKYEGCEKQQMYLCADNYRAVLENRVTLTQLWASSWTVPILIPRHSSPVQLIQRLTAALLSTVAAVHLVLVWAASRQAVEHLPQRRHLPPGLTIAGVHAEGATAFCWEDAKISAQPSVKSSTQTLEVQLSVVTFGVWLQVDVSQPNRLQQGPGEERHRPPLRSEPVCQQRNGTFKEAWPPSSGRELQKRMKKHCTNTESKMVDIYMDLWNLSAVKKYRNKFQPQLPVWWSGEEHCSTFKAL